MSVLEALVATSKPRIVRVPEVAEQELAALRSARESLLGVEQEARGVLDNQIHRLMWDIKLRDTHYTRLDASVLAWQQFGRTRPVFAIYSLNDPLMVIDGDSLANGGGVVHPTPKLPIGLLKHYDPTYLKLGRRTRITSVFGGIIPGPVKEEISFAVDLFRTNVYIVAEADWKTEVRPRPPIDWSRIDPLVVGWDGLDLWLVAKFDLTNIESYVVKEFPALPPGTNPLGLPRHKD